MNIHTWLGLAILLFAGTVDAGSGQHHAPSNPHGSGNTPSEPSASADALHSAERAFTIILNAPLAEATAMFGPVREREWSSAWNPEFIDPAQPVQKEGAVFVTDAQPHGKSTWLLSEYDVRAGRVGYVVFVPGQSVIQFRIRVTAKGGNKSEATVTSHRTALSPAGNDAVDHFAIQFASQGPLWEAAINQSLEAPKPSGN